MFEQEYMCIPYEPETCDSCGSIETKDGLRNARCLEMFLCPKCYRIYKQALRFRQTGKTESLTSVFMRLFNERN